MRMRYINLHLTFDIVGCRQRTTASLAVHDSSTRCDHCKFDIKRCTTDELTDIYC